MNTRWGVLGSGGIAARRTIPESFAQCESADLVAVYDIDQDKNRAIAEQYGLLACQSEEELLNSPCDVIYVATPVHEHCRHVLRAAEAGKHVFCEKPLGRNVDEAAHMVAACKKFNVKIGVGFMMRFHPQHKQILSYIREGKLGVPVYGRAQALCWYPPAEGAWRQNPALGGGGSLIDMGCHCIDLLEMFFGPVRQVFCRTGNRVHPYASEDSAFVLLEFASGAAGFVEACFSVPDRASRNRLELYGSRGSILAEGTIGQNSSGGMIVTSFETDDQETSAQRDDNAMAMPELPDNMYAAEIEAFSRAVLFDTDPPVDGKAGFWNQRIIEACYESARKGTSIYID